MFEQKPRLQRIRAWIMTNEPQRAVQKISYGAGML